MSVIEVHPEELLDRELRGELTERERVLLNAHLMRCAPCRFERQLRADFELEHRSPLPASDLTDVIAGALRACDLPAPVAIGARPPTPVPGQAGGGRSKLWRRAAVALVACAVFGVGIGYAGAQLGLSQTGFSALLERVGVQVSSRPKARPVRAHAARVPKQAAQTAAAVPAREETPLLAPAPAAQPKHGAPAKRAQRAAPKHSVHPPVRTARLGAASQSSVATPVVAAVPERTSEVETDGSKSAVLGANSQASQHEGSTTFTSLVSVPVETASRMFERANRARHRGARGEAIELYDELRERFPDSAEARLSLAVSARMQLDLGEPRAALVGFDAYLAGPDRALHEEAMVGRIRALASLGREREATAAAAALLRSHPRSAFRPEAEALIADAERD